MTVSDYTIAEGQSLPTYTAEPSYMTAGYWDIPTYGVDGKVVSWLNT